VPRGTHHRVKDLQAYIDEYTYHSLIGILIMPPFLTI
jgi:hypothetical protein